MSRALLSPRLDILVLGAGPLLLTLLAALFAESLSPQVALTLLALFSFPHFMGSYFVFYGMRGPWRQHWLIGFVLPLLLVVITSVAITDPAATQLLGHAALMLLYWHYAKQTFGVSLWLGKLNGTPITGRGREITLFCCLLLGSLALLKAELGSASFAIFGIYLKPVDLPKEIIQISRYIAWASVGILSIWLLRPAGRRARHWLALLPIATLASWSDADLISPAVLGILAIFHGAQYLPFPLRVTYKYLTVHFPRSAYVSFVLLWLCLGIAGYALFRMLPISLSPLSPLVPVAAIVLLTLNVHHYFVDAVLWRFHRSDIAQRF